MKLLKKYTTIGKDTNTHLSTGAIRLISNKIFPNNTGRLYSTRYWTLVPVHCTPNINCSFGYVSRARWSRDFFLRLKENIIPSVLHAFSIISSHSCNPCQDPQCTPTSPVSPGSTSSYPPRCS